MSGKVCAPKSLRPMFILGALFILTLGAISWPMAFSSNAQAGGSSIEEPLSQRFICGFPDYEDLMQRDGGTSSRALAATGEHAYIYVDGGNPSQDQINSLMEEFDHKIWPIDTDVFGTISKDKINIHIDTIDGPYGIGGYYIPGTWDIYIDSADLSLWGYEITAHEFQHLIHDKHDNDEELWVNEGMADLAIHIIYGPNAMSVTGHLDAFENMPDNDLTVFENQIYDYGSAYAWTLWVWEHFGGNDTVRRIVDEPRNGFDGVSWVLKSLNASWSYSDIQLFTMWSVANILDDTESYDGIYGYQSVDMSMFVESSYDTYPASIQSDVQSWGNDYYGFRSGDKRDLAVIASRLDGTFNFSLIGIGPADVLVRSGTITPDTPQRTLVIPNFGSQYYTAYLAVSGWTGQRYKFQAELRDNTPPVTALAVNPETPDGLNGFYITKPTIGFVTSEQATTYFHWDDEKEVSYCQSCSPPRVPNAQDGNHTLFYRSVDPEGNAEKPIKSQLFLVDTTKPETFANITPVQPNGEKGWYVTPVTVSLSSEPGAAIFYRWDSGFYHNYTGPMMGEEGAHSIHYYSRDIAGNEGDIHSLDVKMDLTAPLIKFDIYPALPDGLGGYFKTQPTVAMSVDEPGVTILYMLDNSVTFVYQQPVKIAEGTHSIQFWAVDEAGNEGQVQTRDFIVDTVVPSTVLRTDPSKPDGLNGWYIDEPKVMLETDKDATPYYILDDGAQRKYVGAIQVAEGAHTIRYWSKDRAGNVEPERTISIQVDMTPPVTKCKVDGTETGGWFLDPPTITIDLEQGATGYYMWDDGPENKYIIPLHPRDGEHKFSCYAIDAAGNKGELRSMTLQTDSIDPTAFFTTTPAYAFTGKQVILDAANSTDNIEIVSYFIDFGDGTSEDLRGETVINHVYNAPGTFHVTLTVTDQSGRKGSFTKDIYVERPPKKENVISGYLENPFILALGFILILAIVGLGIARYRHKQKVLRAVAAYEAFMAQRAEAIARANRAKAKAKKARVKRPQGPKGPFKAPIVRK